MMSSLLMRVALIVPLACGTPAFCQNGVPARDYWPTADWRTRPAAELSVDTAKLTAMDAFIKGSLAATSSVLLVRHGYLVWETYYAGDRSTLRPIYSVTKSIISILTGTLAKSGKIRDVDDTMLSYLPDIASGQLASGAEKITVRHLLTMSSGFPTDGGKGTLFVKGYLAKPLATTPGEAFAYNGTNPDLLSIILTHLSGQTADEYAPAALFKPLGIGEHGWTKEYLYSNGAEGISMTSRDLAKIGYLYLNRGTWDGTAIVTPEWVTASTTVEAPESSYTLHWKGYGSARYGFLWWIAPLPHAYFASGHDGQSITVLPDQDAVVVITADAPLVDTGNETSDRYWPIITDYIVPAMR